MTASTNSPIDQPAFDSRIQTLKYPLGGGQFGNLQRGYMVWDSTQLLTGYSSAARMNFLFNPSTITATYSLIPDTSVQAAMMFPTAYNNTDLRVPLSQTVEWSLLFDRTFELWGSYDNSGNAINGQAFENINNDPSVVGVQVDIAAMQQFTGMNANFYSGSSASVGNSSSDQIAGSLYNQQGIMMPVYSYAWFGKYLWFYGYVSEWDVTITHWTQYMIPMRCVINVTFTMMPTPAPTTGSNANTEWSAASIAQNTLNSITHLPGATQSTAPGF